MDDALDIDAMNETPFKGQRVLVTGHTGFKGSWLTLWLRQLGAEVYGYSLPPPTKPSNYELSTVRDMLAGETLADIRDRPAMLKAVTTFAPRVVFHLAAQPLVRESYANPFETFDVNVMGTASVLDAVRALNGDCAVVCVTSDKCYDNREQVWGYRECDPMGGNDPYSASKGAAEILIAAYRRSFFDPRQRPAPRIQLASARAGNVIGGGDWARDRIVPDLVAALLAGRNARVRNPGAVRPWQHVLDSLSGYLTLAAAMLDTPDPRWADAWNFGPAPGMEKTVGQLADAFMDAWGGGSWTRDPGCESLPEAAVLRLSIEKAGALLGWRPRWPSGEAIERTARWYRRVYGENGQPREACEADLKDYGCPICSPSVVPTGTAFP